ncbi:recombinase RecT [Acidovorax sp. LjRoot74]|uniref:RecT family recombinase n=1 Tax=Acidovorax sp. LjRoot74 TaxID=3342337 RepID=UPI003ECC57DB
MNAASNNEQNALTLSGASSTGLVLSNDTMDKAFRMAELMASGRSTVPKHLQGSPADCMAVTLQALQWNMSPFAVAQKTHLVNGTLGYEAQLVNAVLQSTGAIVGDFEYEYQGSGKNDLKCRVGAIPRGKTEIKWGEWLSITEVATKNSPLWNTNPRQQMGYLQVKNWARAFKPGAILGVYTPDELEATGGIKDMGPADVVKPEPTPYPAEQFAANLPKWREVIQGARKTADDLIAFTESRNPNTPMTEEQKATLRGIKPVKNAAATDVLPKGEAAAPTGDAGPAVTFAQVSDKLHAAKDVDSLNLAADLVSQVPDTQKQAELNALYEQRLGEFAHG